jgi:hypothetical protein
VGLSRESALPNGVRLSERSGLPDLTEIEAAAKSGHVARPYRVAYAELHF